MPFDLWNIFLHFQHINLPVLRITQFITEVMPSCNALRETLGFLNKESFLCLLTKLIGESKYVQNNPPELIPEEDRVVKHVLDSLLPYSTTTGGGPLVVNHVSYFPCRGNLIVEYPGTVPDKILSFVGMHMDVVTANPNDWVSFFSLSSFMCFSLSFFPHSFVFVILFHLFCSISSSPLIIPCSNSKYLLI